MAWIATGPGVGKFTTDCLACDSSLVQLVVPIEDMRYDHVIDLADPLEALGGVGDHVTHALVEFGISVERK
jgi:hypothetical protein